MKKNCKNISKDQEKDEDEVEEEKKVVECVKQIETVLNECQQQTASKLMMVAKRATCSKSLNLVERVQRLIFKAERLFDGRQLDETQPSRSLYAIKLYELLMDLFIQNQCFDKALLIATNKLINAYELVIKIFSQ